VAAELLRDRITGAPAEWHAIFDPRRELPVVDTGIVSSHRQGLPFSAAEAIAALAPGGAIVIEDGGEEIAVHRDDAGAIHRVSAVCTHQRCIVLWESVDREWACPCHGSRFAPTGDVIKGPAKEPLPPR
jgi:Rieske Fe-S protein